MAGPIQFDPTDHASTPLGKALQPGAGLTGSAKSSESGPNFKDVLLDSLNQVNQLQEEASQGVERILTGESDNVAEVFTAVRKAGVAFDLLMEMRNKLLDAYNEMQRMQI
jgi:flagellar hook-basal body complex protein FliE